MSDAVALALITMFQAWGEAMFNNMAVIVSALGTAIIGWMTWRNNQRAEARAESIKTKVAEVEASAVTSAVQANLMAKGAERIGVEMGVGIGVEKERKRASDQASIRAAFQPENTDVFMRRTDGPDQDTKR